MEQHRLDRCLRSVQRGRLSCALASLTDSSSAPPSPTTVFALQASLTISLPSGLDVGDACPWLPSYCTTQSLSIRDDLVREALSTLPRGFLWGATSWLSDHLQYLCIGQAAVLSQLRRWVKAILKLVEPATYGDWWSTSSLVAFSKPGEGVRPIAVGEVLPQFVSRVCVKALKEAMVDHFHTTGQLGVAVPYETEKLHHSVRSALALHPEWVVIRVDVANAFNTVDRVAMFDHLRSISSFSPLILFLRFLYLTPSTLLYTMGAETHTLSSSAGVRQGDPLAQPFPFLPRPEFSSAADPGRPLHLPHHQLPR